MLAYSGWSFLTRWRSTSCIGNLHFLDHVCGGSWCAPWSRASGAQARDQAGHVRKELPVRLLLCLKTLAPLAERRRPHPFTSFPASKKRKEETLPERTSDDQEWQRCLKT